MDGIIVVDNETVGPASRVTQIKENILEQTDSSYVVEVIGGRNICLAADEVKQRVGAMQLEGQDVKALFIDLTQPGELNAGIVLLEKLRKDPALSDTPAVIYTTRFAPIMPEDVRRIQELKAKLVRMRIVDHTGLPGLTRQMLREVNILR